MPEEEEIVVEEENVIGDGENAEATTTDDSATDPLVGEIDGTSNLSTDQKDVVDDLMEGLDETTEEQPDAAFGEQPKPEDGAVMVIETEQMEGPDDGASSSARNEEEEESDRVAEKQTEYDERIDAVKHLAEMTSTDGWKKLYAHMISEMKQIKENMLSIKSGDLAKCQALVLCYRDIIEQQLKEVKDLNKYINHNPLFCKSSIEPFYMGADFDFKIGTVIFTPLNNREDLKFDIKVPSDIY